MMPSYTRCYLSFTEKLYTHQTEIDGDRVTFEILDTAGCVSIKPPSSHKSHHLRHQDYVCGDKQIVCMVKSETSVQDMTLVMSV